MTRERAAIGALTAVLMLAAWGGTGALGSAGRRTAAPSIPSGNGAAPRGVGLRIQPVSTINPFKVFRDARYQDGGTGMRNQQSWGLLISGVAGVPIKAYLYWAFITSGPAEPAQSGMKIQRREPTKAGVKSLKGVVVGTGATPCWGGDTITVFRAGVPLAVASGNGSYEVGILPGAAGSIAGEDPWAFAALPEAEGASLVIVYEAAGVVTSLFDVGLAGATFFSTPGLAYELALPVPASGGSTLWDNIGADGQRGLSRMSFPGVANEDTRINGVPVAGPGSDSNDSDWNGDDSTPIPSLWDTAGHDITSATPAGTATLKVSVVGPSGSGVDCLTPIANVVTES